WLWSATSLFWGASASFSSAGPRSPPSWSRAPFSLSTWSGPAKAPWSGTPFPRGTTEAPSSWSPPPRGDESRGRTSPRHDHPRGIAYAEPEEAGPPEARSSASFVDAGGEGGEAERLAGLQRLRREPARAGKA